MTDRQDLETQIKSIDERTARIEQILPTFATKDDLKAFATKEDFNLCVTKEDAKAFATKDDVREEGERTRRHFDMVADQMRDQIALIAEGHKALESSSNARFNEIKTVLDKHDKRIMKLEAESIKRRR